MFATIHFFDWYDRPKQVTSGSYSVRIRSLIVLILSYFLSLATVRAGVENVRFERLSIQDGLSQSVITSIYQDSKGFMWFGTQDGLNRYNGYDFEIFRNIPDDSTSLSENQIPSLLTQQINQNAIVEDRNGDLWIATFNGVNRFNYEDGTFTRFEYDPNDSNGIGGPLVGAVVPDTTAGLWLVTIAQPYGVPCVYDLNANEMSRFRAPDSSRQTFTLNVNENYSFALDLDGFGFFSSNRRGLFKLDKRTGSVTRFTYDPEQAGGLPDSSATNLLIDSTGMLWVGFRNGSFIRMNPATEEIDSFFPHAHNWPDTVVNGFFEDSRHHIWILTRDGLLRFNRDHDELTRFVHDPANPNSMISNNVLWMFEDHTGSLWIRSQQGGITRFNPASEKFQRYLHTADNPGQWPIRQMFEDSRGDLWVLLFRNGILRYDRINDNFIHFVSNLDDPQTLGNDDIRGIYEDRSGTIWLTCFGAGLSTYHPTRNKFHHIARQPRLENTLSDNIVWSFYEDEPGTIWIGTNNGLNRYSFTEQHFQRFYNDPNDAHSLPHNGVRAFCTDQFGIFWVGTFNGLGRFNQKTQDFTVYRPAPGDSTSLVGPSVSALFKDSDDVFWIGTNNGLSRYRPESNTFLNFQNDPTDHTSLGGNNILKIIEDDAGNLWLASAGGGLSKMDRTTQTFSVYRHLPSDPQSLPSDNVQTVLQDREGRLWVGTWSGLARFYPETETFSSYTTKDGLPNDAVYGIVEDDNGQLWLSTNNGLSRFDPASQTFRNYFVDDGLQSNEFNQCAYYKDREGRLYFGGIGGFNYFFTDEIRGNDYEPPVVLTDVKIFEQSTRFDRSLNDLEQLSLTYRENFFAFEFAALDYSNPSKNQYAYRLVGFDDDWRYCGTRRFVNYTNLPGGDYIFQVKGSNSDGYWSETPYSINLTIIPPFWKTTWFYILEVFSVIGLVIGILIFQRRRYHYKMEFQRKTGEMNLARKVQLSMLPHQSINNDQVEITGKIITATEVGGDYYDFTEMQPYTITATGEKRSTRYAISIGDATGHGVAAGLFVGMIKMTSIYALQVFRENSTLKDLVQDLNFAMRRSHSQRSNMGMCYCISILDMNTKTMQLSSAGMPYPYHFRRETRELVPMIMKCPPLGFLKRIDAQDRSIKLQSGDVVLFLSDGFEERFNPVDETWGDENLERALLEICLREEAPNEIINALIAECDAFAQGRETLDDMTMVVVQIK